MTRPRLLDLFCGAGGAAWGYHAAGFDVTGVDIARQPRYPFEFHQGDALDVLATLAGRFGDVFDFDAIHASPPCQKYSVTRHNWNARKDHPDLLGPTRDRLLRAGKPYIIENVPGAPMAPLIMLCGSSFGLGTREYQLRRHRWFEPSPGLWFMSPPCQHSGPVIGIYGDHGRDHRRTDASLGRYFTLAERQEAMGIDWMARDELDQAIPPAYTEYIGRELMARLREAAA
jgi:DNA (cytosine-5)-methyltransferase 1